ncbi:MAG: DUF3276 family protein [Flavobacteriales bacterium]
MEVENNNREEIFSKSVRAGKRTYFFDVKTTRGNDLYLTVTESKKRMGKDGQFYFEKHKIYLYKEDFEKFTEGLNEAIQKIDELKATGNYETIEYTYSNENNTASNNVQADVANTYSNVSFEDLDK